jgi:hypothetical protein
MAAFCQLRFIAVEDAEFEKISPACQDNSARVRIAELSECSQLFIGAKDETLPAAAIAVSNEVRPPASLYLSALRPRLFRLCCPRSPALVRNILTKN